MRVKVKNGMKDSSAGRGRWEKTAVLKAHSKGARRREARARVREGLREG
jgi:hypothetical protein